jgi:CHAT domain-containing protein/Tfp pilus assembly protein PilF
MTERRHRKASPLLSNLILGHVLPVHLALPTILTFLLVLTFTTTPAAAPQEQTQSTTPQEDSKPVVLEPGKPLERQLKGGEKHTYEIRAEAAQFLHAEVEQLGIDVALTLYAPNGKPIASMDSPNGNFGPEKISTIAEAHGLYVLEVASDDQNVAPGHYRVTLEPARAPDDKDRARITAERLFSQAIQLLVQGSGDSLRAAAQKYVDCLPFWQTADDVYEQGLTNYSIGDVYSSIGERQKALDFYSRALTLEHSAGDRSGEAATLNNIARVYSAWGEKQKALGYYNQALPIWRALGNRAGEGATLDGIGNVYDDLGDEHKALDFHNQALPLHRAAGDRNGEAATLNNIGSVYNALGETQKALDYYSQALPLRRAVGDRAGEAISLNNIGSVYANLGDKRKAMEYFDQALPLLRATGDRNGEAVTLGNLCVIYDDLGEKQKALDVCNQALPLWRAVGDRSGEAATLTNIGVIYDGLGEKQMALDYYNQALPLRRAVGDRNGEASTLDNIGQAYYTLGENQKALDYYNQSLSLERAIGDRRGESFTLNYLGQVYDALGDKQKALDYYQQSLLAHRAVGNRSGEATELGNIGLVYDVLGDKPKALEYYNLALSLKRAVGDRSGEATTLNNLGALSNRVGEKQQALEYLQEALALLHALRDPLGQAHVLRNLMIVWRDLQQPDTAIFFGKQSVSQIQQVRSNIRSLGKDTQHSFLSSKEKTYRDLADILISQGRLPEAQQVLDLLKNEEYFDFIRRDERQAASLTAPVALTKKEGELNSKYEKNISAVTAVGDEWAALRAKPSRTPEEEKHLEDLTGKLKLANQAWDKFLNDLSTELAKSTQPQTTVGALQENASALQRVVRQLGSGTVALYTLVGEEKYHVILVTPAVQLAREYPIKAADLNKKVAVFREALLDPDSNPVPNAQELYEILVAPIAKDLDGAQATTLMWSLDGALRYLPISALHDGHGYLVEKYRNIVFTPTSVPALAAPTTVSQWHGLGMGVSKSYAGMNALPTVPAELHAIIREAGTAPSAGVMPGHTMLDETFTEDNLKKELLQKYPLVHIASHFVFGAGNDTDSYLLLGGKDPQGQKLSLAEINDDPDISFNDVELLTLSACNTALTIPGDGHEVDGLGILAQRKGAKAVLATLWSVYDPSTSLLMQTFYRNWTTGSPVSKAEALRRAQVAFLHAAPEQPASKSGALAAKSSYAHPYYWAPFILIGNWQ